MMRRMAGSDTPTEHNLKPFKKFIAMKTYYAVIEICKLYKEGYSVDTVLWQKPFKTRQEAGAFIKRIGKGKKKLYSVNYVSIDIAIE